MLTTHNEIQDWINEKCGYDQDPKWYFWKAGWEDEFELEWFDDKDAAYEV